MAVAVAVAVIYVVYFTDWFQPKTVKIFHTNRNLRQRSSRGNSGALPNLIFGVSQQLRLTEIVVVPSAVWQTNHNAIPVWHLVSDSNSVPVKSFYYGQYIGGMKSAVKGAHPQSLETNLSYRLIIAAGSIKGEHEFELK